MFWIVWAGAKQSRSPGAEQTPQVQVYQLPVGVDGLASLARYAGRARAVFSSDSSACSNAAPLYSGSEVSGASERPAQLVE